MAGTNVSEEFATDCFTFKSRAPSRSLSRLLLLCLSVIRPAIGQLLLPLCLSLFPFIPLVFLARRNLFDALPPSLPLSLSPTRRPKTRASDASGRVRPLSGLCRAGSGLINFLPRAQSGFRVVATQSYGT